MKKLLLTLCLVALAGTTGLLAQTCTPNPILTVLGIPGIYPNVLQNPDLPDATLGQPYSTTFTFIVLGDTTIDLSTIIPLPGAPTVNVDVESQIIDSISGLPAGLSYSCNPPTCIIPGDSAGCLIISGTPTVAGDFVVGLESRFGLVLPQNPLLGPFAGTTQFAPIPGQDYNMKVQDNGVSIADLNDEAFVVLQNAPNPFRGSTDIHFSAPRPVSVDFTVTDLTGKMLSVSAHKASAGTNTITFDASGFAPGLYFYTLSDGTRSVTKKMFIAE